MCTNERASERAIDMKMKMKKIPQKTMETKHTHQTKMEKGILPKKEEKEKEKTDQQKEKEENNAMDIVF